MPFVAYNNKQRKRIYLLGLTLMIVPTWERSSGEGVLPIPAMWATVV
jgi:hypothetical protein